MKEIVVKKEYKISLCDQCDYFDKIKTDHYNNCICKKTNKGVPFKVIDSDKEYGFGYYPIPKWCPYGKEGEMIIKDGTIWGQI